MSKTKKILTAVTLVWLCLLLVMFTYTWVLRNWTPSIQQEDLRISPAGALVISLMDDSNYNEVNLNQVVDLESFVFKQVSSADGQNFLRLDFSPTINEQPAVYQRILPDSVGLSIVEAKFAVKLDDELESPKYVFLHPDCFITDNNENLDVAGAIRISLDYEIVNAEGKTENVVHIFGNTDEPGGIDYNTNAVLRDADGKTVDDDSATSQQKKYSFDYFNGGRTGDFNEDNPADPENYNFTPDPDKCLFKLEPGDIKWVTMRIWLEGADENCKNAIAGQTFDMKLKFDSVTVKE